MLAVAQMRREPSSELLCASNYKRLPHESLLCCEALCFPDAELMLM